jgi:hypothetical protein
LNTSELSLPRLRSVRISGDLLQGSNGSLHPALRKLAHGEAGETLGAFVLWQLGAMLPLPIQSTGPCGSIQAWLVLKHATRASIS